MNFSVIAADGAARRGVLELAHGRVDTPAFMKTQPPTKFLSLNSANWMNGFEVVNECARK